jgi:hypothetical protein
MAKPDTSSLDQRQHAADALRCIGTDAAVSGMVAALDDSDGFVRLSAIGTLHGRSEYAAAVEAAWIACMQDPVARVRYVAVLDKPNRNSARVKHAIENRCGTKTSRCARQLAGHCSTRRPEHARPPSQKPNPCA